MRLKHAEKSEMSFLNSIFFQFKFKNNLFLSVSHNYQKEIPFLLSFFFFLSFSFFPSFYVYFLFFNLCLVHLFPQNLVQAYWNFLSMLNFLCLLKIILVYSKVRFLHINWLIWVYLKCFEYTQKFKDTQNKFWGSRWTRHLYLYFYFHFHFHFHFHFSFSFFFL